MAKSRKKKQPAKAKKSAKAKKPAKAKAKAKAKPAKAKAKAKPAKAKAKATPAKAKPAKAKPAKATPAKARPTEEAPEAEAVAVAVAAPSDDPVETEVARLLAAYDGGQIDNAWDVINEVFELSEKLPTTSPQHAAFKKMRYELEDICRETSS
jgi:hypothetical protein